ncbi:hypothetical protein E2C01_032789 [Portunus trituberculatus]|uniref:Uncharacterized protein n=1 Tax=Portunus trituberculatus TaxID=210409 RepID=A0A5B7F201_PORTR|nr:hypothetical protein [Portunus trituberculatus]
MRETRVSSARAQGHTSTDGQRKKLLPYLRGANYSFPSDMNRLLYTEGIIEYCLPSLQKELSNQPASTAETVSPSIAPSVNIPIITKVSLTLVRRVPRLRCETAFRMSSLF